MKVKDEAVEWYRSRYKLWFCAFIQVAILGGATYGWAGLKSILERAGYWTKDPTTNEAAYGVLWTIGAWINQVGRLFLGVYLDYFGVKMTTVTGFTMCCVGLTILAFSTVKVNLVSPGFILLCLGGPAIQLATQSVSKLFQNKAMVMSSLIAAFQLSTMWFMLLNLLNESGVKDIILFSLYAAVAGCLAVWCYIIYPPRFNLSKLNDEDTCHEYGVSRKSLLITTGRYAEDFLETGTICEMMCSAEYIMLNIWYSCYVLYLDFYVMTVQTQTWKMTGKKLTLEFTICVWTFSAWAIGAGYCIDKYGFGHAVLSNIGFSASALMLLTTNSIQLQTIGSIMSVLSKVTTHSIFFSFIGINFGFKNFGTLAGFALLISGFFSLFEYLLLDVVEYDFEDNYRQMNLFLAIWCTFWGGIFTFFLFGMEFKSSNGNSESAYKVKYRGGTYVIKCDETHDR